MSPVLRSVLYRMRKKSRQIDLAIVRADRYASERLLRMCTHPQYMTIIVRSFKFSATAQSVATDLPATDAEGLRSTDKHRKNA